MSSDRHENGRIVVALPADDEPIHAFGEEDKHLTLLWLGTPEENPDLDLAAVKAAVEEYASQTPPFVATIDKTGALGEDGAKVAFLSASEVPHRDQMMENQELAAAVGAVEQFPEFLPHVTLTYEDELGSSEGDEPPPDPTGAILFDRLALWADGERVEFPLQKVTALPVTDVFTLKRSMALADKLPTGPVREAARRMLSRRARELGCRHEIPTQWLRDRAASAKLQTALVERYKSTVDNVAAPVVAAATFTQKSIISGIPDDILRAAYIRGVREYTMTSVSSRPPLTRDQFALARVNSLIRAATGDLTARIDDLDLLARLKEY